MISSRQEPTTANPQPISDPRPLTPDPRSPSRAWMLRIAGTLVFVGLLVWLDLKGALPIGDVLITLAHANAALVVLSIALYVPFLIVKSARWRIVCSDMR